MAAEDCVAKDDGGCGQAEVHPGRVCGVVDSAVAGTDEYAGGDSCDRWMGVAGAAPAHLHCSGASGDSLLVADEAGRRDAVEGHGGARCAAAVEGGAIDTEAFED